MCGIGGFVQFQQKIGDLATLKAMGQAIYHRGPDAGGEYVDDMVSLCHRRLAIIDLSEAGNQPMYSPDKNLVLVFNGEIYNFLELRAHCEQKGYEFRTRTDTEVILALYQLEGDTCVERLSGMFAFALWDKTSERLLIARDRLGKKPLYYYQHAGQFIFASEIKAILTLPGLNRELRDDAIYDFFCHQYIPDPKTVFRHIHKLPPAHLMVIDRHGVKTSAYWDLSFKHTLRQSEAELKDRLLGRIELATKQRMVSDVPLGAFLSGGVDSSGVVALMAKNSTTPVTTCTIGFDNKKFDETKFAKLVADQYHTRHHELTVASKVEDRLEEIAAYFDEPFADPSFVPTFFVSELARQKVTVALAGDGGDEAFAGYHKYAVDQLENRLRSKVPALLRKHLLPALGGLLKLSDNTLFRKGRTLINTLAVDADHGFYMANAFCSDALWQQVCAPEFARKVAGYHPSEVTVNAYRHCDGHDHLSRILYADVKTYLPGDILVKVDRMSMANSLEVRAPIMDYEVFELAAQIPSHLKLNGNEKKYILKEAFKPLLSEETLYRKKMGFSVPLAQWLRVELRQQAETLLFAPNAGIRNYLAPNALRDIWQRHQAGKGDYGSILWSALCFELWWQRYVG